MAKRRVRVQPNNPYYSNEPAVAKNLIADQGLTQNASLGNQPSKMVDKKPGRMSGIANFVDKKRPGAKSATLGLGKTSGSGKPPGASGVPKQGGGHLRMSGHPNAHRLGVGSIKLKV